MSDVSKAVSAVPIGLLESEHLSPVGVRQVDDMHAAGVCRAIGGQRRATSDHHLGVRIHERPVSFGELLEEGIGALTVATVEEVFQQPDLSVRDSSGRSSSRSREPRKRLLTCEFTSWALRDSNPRPSPCKGETDLLVRALSCGNALPLSTSEYLRVRSSRYADVMRRPEVDAAIRGPKVD